MDASHALLGAGPVAPIARPARGVPKPLGHELGPSNCWSLSSRVSERIVVCSRRSWEQRFSVRWRRL
eukprot:7877515-Alexandrium_andersonii.AAC.1